MKICSSISFRITGGYSSLTEAVDGILEFINKAGKKSGEDIFFDIKVILNELITNAIKHGNGCDCSKYVSITAAVTDDGYVCLMVKDEGKGYDLDEIKRKYAGNCNPQDVSHLSECGRGMMIVKKLSDRVLISDNGSRIEVFKKL